MYFSLLSEHTRCPSSLISNAKWCTFSLELMQNEVRPGMIGSGRERNMYSGNSLCREIDDLLLFLDTAIVGLCVVVVLLSLRWGCREHFVSGCWHSSGRDRGRYSRECWLSTLGVLHPGVPVMWYGHIRDLSPTAEGCMGGRLPNVTLLHWAKQPWWCKAVMVWWMEVGWEGSPPHIIAHHARCTCSS